MGWRIIGVGFGKSLKPAQAFGALELQGMDELRCPRTALCQPGENLARSGAAILRTDDCRQPQGRVDLFAPQGQNGEIIPPCRGTLAARLEQAGIVVEFREACCILH